MPDGPEFLDSYEIPDDDDVLIRDCRVDTFRAGGKGGQHQNRTESGVRLTHLPTGLVVEVRNTPSQHRNRAIAISRLREALVRRARRPKPRTPTKVPHREKVKRLEEKKRRSRTKAQRKPPEPDA